MNYEKIINLIKEEVSKEREVVDELSYKNGYSQAVKDLDGNCKCKNEDKCCEEEITEEDLKESFSYGYFTGIEEFSEIVCMLMDMSDKERMDIFGLSSVERIVNKIHPIDIIETLCEYEFEEEKDIAVEVISSNLSNDIKKAIIDMLEANDQE